MAAVPPVLLGAAIAGGWLAYGGLIAYALAVGAAGAFVMPARDAMLTRVAGSGLGRAVAVMTAVPGVTAVMSPEVALTVAIAVLFDAQVTAPETPASRDASTGAATAEHRLPPRR